MDGKSPDRIPWIPRMLLWWLYHRNRGTLPEQYQGMPLRAIERDLGMGTPARNGKIFTRRRKGTQIVTTNSGMDCMTDFITPVGTVSSMTRRTTELDLAGIHALEIEKPLKSPEDYDVMEYIIENTQYFPTYDEYLVYEEDVGDDGYPMVDAGDCPLHTFLEKLAGYEKGYMDLADHTERVERLLNLMWEKDREELWPVILDSPARLILHGFHFDSQLTPPRMFEKYIKPYYQEFSELLHKRGKVLAMHADADSSRILGHLQDAGYDMMECFTTTPLVKCTLKEAREAWDTDMIIWGGIPSIILEDTYPEEDFEADLDEMFKAIAPGDAFILGVADNVTGPANFDRIVRVGQMIEERGRYPVTA